MKDDFICMELDSVRVEGKKNAIRLYEVIEKKGKATEIQLRFVKGFQTALVTFRQGEFKKAKTLFENLDDVLELEKEKAVKLYLSRIDELIKTPPATDWDFTYSMAK